MFLLQYKAFRALWGYCEWGSHARCGELCVGYRDNLECTKRQHPDISFRRPLDIQHQALYKQTAHNYSPSSGPPFLKNLHHCVWEQLDAAPYTHITDNWRLISSPESQHLTMLEVFTTNNRFISLNTQQASLNTISPISLQVTGYTGHQCVNDHPQIDTLIHV